MGYNIIALVFVICLFIAASIVDDVFPKISQKSFYYYIAVSFLLATSMMFGILKVVDYITY